MEPKKFGGRGARARRQKVGRLAFCARRVLMFLIPIVLPINHSPAFWLPFCGYNCSVWMEGFGYGNEPLVSGFIGEMYIMTKSSVCCAHNGGAL